MRNPSFNDRCSEILSAHSRVPALPANTYAVSLDGSKTYIYRDIAPDELPSFIEWLKLGYAMDYDLPSDSAVTAEIDTYSQQILVEFTS